MTMMIKINIPLLSLLPPSCMVAPIRELRNITYDTFTLCTTTNKMASDKDIVMRVTLLTCFSTILTTIMMRYMVTLLHIVHTVLELHPCF